MNGLRVGFVQLPRWQSARRLFDLQNIFPFHHVSSFVTAFFIILDMCFPSLIPFPFALFNFRLLQLICLVGLLFCVDKTHHDEVVFAISSTYIPLFSEPEDLFLEFVCLSCMILIRGCAFECTL